MSAKTTEHALVAGGAGFTVVGILALGPVKLALASIEQVNALISAL